MFTIDMQNLNDPQAVAEEIRRRRYGVIETVAGRLQALHFRLWPKLLAWPEVWPTGPLYHASGEPDRCLLYFNQPRGHSNFLALKYIVSTHGSSFATFRTALAALDAVACTKRTDALLCDAFNARLSDRLMQRFGWQSHKPQRWHRNYIKRFYGSYPQVAAPWLPATAGSASMPMAELAL